MVDKSRKLDFRGVTVDAADFTVNDVSAVGGGGVQLNTIAGTANGSATATLTTNAVTATKRLLQITTEALTTAAGAAQAFVITISGVAATDLAFVQDAGGTNTRKTLEYAAICTTNTVTVTVNNIGPTNAINGTLIFNLLVLKA